MVQHPRNYHRKERMCKQCSGPGVEPSNCVELAGVGAHGLGVNVLVNKPFCFQKMQL